MNNGDFPIAMFVYQRVTIEPGQLKNGDVPKLC